MTADDDEVQRRLGELRRAIEDQQAAELAAARGEADRMEAEAERAHARIQDLEAELSSARREAADTRREADRMEEDAEAAHRRIQELEAELAALTAAEPEPKLVAEPEPELVAEPEPEAPRARVPVWSDPSPIDINAASVDDLVLLPGIGRRPAERIIAFRNERGRLQSIDELFEITEVPRERLTRIRAYIRV